MATAGFGIGAGVDVGAGVNSRGRIQYEMGWAGPPLVVA